MTKHPTTTVAGDIGRRVAMRREELGLSPEDVAAHAGIDPGYLRYVEQDCTAAPGVATLRGLAMALDTSVSALSGGEADLPPGRGQAAGRAELVELGSEECWKLLSTHGVGRLALSMPDGLTVLPVNYCVADGAIAFRTSPAATPAEATDGKCAFEVDEVDDALSQGWSVLVRGMAHTVTDPTGVRRLNEQAYTGPWAGGERDLWVRITPASVTGRRIVVG
ncbi:MULTISPECIES: pyridoxamine 5'-phosphate oxidase family protein [unclassified Streptomyces]|uniref:helix-turn-helix domain-containing protein n=1 Tax=unclassified Streptomyces TaxID=2593676 RepID=UPI000380C6F2|nr:MULTISPECIES: pyridoxamine 5'-phosphate oxidase family protein [unclassified Streptomyces]MYX32879.1 helix-turn-helix domain-containing protein [Streptomyces sp. SID8377]